MLSEQRNLFATVLLSRPSVQEAPRAGVGRVTVDCVSGGPMTVNTHDPLWSTPWMERLGSAKQSAPRRRVRPTAAHILQIPAQSPYFKCTGCVNAPLPAESQRAKRTHFLPVASNGMRNLWLPNGAMSDRRIASRSTF